MSSVSSTQTTQITSAFGTMDRVAELARDPLILIGRLMLGWLFLSSGWGKLLNYDGAVASLVSRGVPDWLAHVAPVAEFLGGTLLIVGLATRYAAVLVWCSQSLRLSYLIVTGCPTLPKSPVNISIFGRTSASWAELCCFSLPDRAASLWTRFCSGACEIERCASFSGC